MKVTNTESSISLLSSLMGFLFSSQPFWTVRLYILVYIVNFFSYNYISTSRLLPMKFYRILNLLEKGRPHQRTYPLPVPVQCCNYYKEIHTIALIPMVCRNLCERINSKIQVGRSNYLVGKKYCRRCEIYLYNDGTFCPCCGIQLRTTPHNKK